MVGVVAGEVTVGFEPEGVMPTRENELLKVAHVESSVEVDKCVQNDPLILRLRCYGRWCVEVRV